MKACEKWPNPTDFSVRFNIINTIALIGGEPYLIISAWHGERALSVERRRMTNERGAQKEGANEWGGRENGGKKFGRAEK